MTRVDFQKDLCLLENHMATQWNNKIYILGGNQWLKPKDFLTKPYKYASSYMRILDFTSSTNISSSSILSIQKVPPRIVPPIKWGNLFAQDGKLYIFGGEQELWSELHEDGTTPPDDDRRPAIANTLFTYDIEKDAWGSSQSRLGPKKPGSTNFAYDPYTGVGWVYSGVHASAGYYVNQTFVKGPSGDPEYLKDMIKFDIAKSVLEKQNLSVNPVGPVESGTMAHIPYVGQEGVLVVLGGKTEYNVMRDMTKIHIYDIHTKTWFTQDATSEGGNAPIARYRFCSVSTNSSDKSSHHIFIYGGKEDPDAKMSLKSVYVLSLPSFHWIYIGESTLGKSSHACQKLQEKYLVSFRGRGEFTSTDGNTECDINEGIQLFDMEKLEWTPSYEVRSGSSSKRDTETTEPIWRVPKRISDIIGGDETGKTTFTTPKRGWSDEKLSTIFFTIRETNAPAPPSEDPSSSPSSRPPIGAILGGVLGGTALFVAIVFLAIYLRKIKRRRKPFIVVNELPADSRLLRPGMGGSEGNHPTNVELPGAPSTPVEIGPGISRAGTYKGPFSFR